jgi:ABC-2 type transport system ATP-binding protein
MGLRRPDKGSIRVMGVDPVTQRHALHLLVGAQLQSSALPDKLRVGELVSLYASFYPDPADVAELMEAMGLAEKRRSYYRSLSGGQRQRLAIILALVGQPRVAVLDEMTTGLDPQARRDTWDLIEGVRDRGVTILLVTHFMEEAERLCDRAAVIDRGQLVAIDTPAGLVAHTIATKEVRFRPSGTLDDRLLTGLPEVQTVKHECLHVVVTGTGDLVNAVILTLAAAGVTAHDVTMATSSLEDAFVALTGRHGGAKGRVA